MTTTAQLPLPGMPSTIQTFWDAWWEEHSPEFGERPDWDAVLEAMINAVPRGLLPSGDALMAAQLSITLRRWMKAHGLRGLDIVVEDDAGAEAEPRKVVVVELELPLEDLSSLLTGDLARARDDVRSAKARLHAWNEVHGEIKNENRYFAELCKAAGL